MWVTDGGLRHLIRGSLASVHKLTVALGLALSAAGAGSLTAAGDTIPCPGGNASVTRHVLAVSGSTATASVVLSPGCANVQLSLVSYEATRSFDLTEQRVFDHKTVTVFAADTLSVSLPNCFFQVDLVRGSVLASLSEATGYTAQQRMLATVRGGTAACTTPVTPAPQGTGVAAQQVGRLAVTGGGMQTSKMVLGALLTLLAFLLLIPSVLPRRFFR